MPEEKATENSPVSAETVGNFTESSSVTDSNQIFDEGADKTSDTDGQSAESSNAEKQVDAKDSNPKSLLDVVKNAAKTKEKTDEKSSLSEEGSKEKDSDKSAKQQESDKNLPFHNHPRWKEINKRVKDLEGPASQYGRIEEFMGKNNLNASEVAEGFKVMSLLKNDPEKALAMLEQYADNIRLALGEKLPQDLQEKVDSGEITEEMAKKYAVTKADSEATQAKLKAERDRKAQDNLRNFQTSIKTAVNTWEEGVKSRDPDYLVKQPMVQERVRAIIAETGQPPRTEKEAVSLAQQALKDVEDRLKTIRPGKATITNTPAALSPSSEPQAKSIRDAVRAGIRA